MKPAALTVDTHAPRTATLLWCVLGLLVPRATLFGELAPFGIGLAACSAAANLPMMLCLGVGYLLSRPVLEPLRYMAAVAMVGGVRWVLEAAPNRGRGRLVPPLIAFVCCAVTGLTLLGFSGIDLYRTLLILAESAVAAGSALFFNTAMLAGQGEGLTTTASRTAVMLTAAVAVTAAAGVQVGGFSPGRVAAAFLVLMLARSGRESGGSVAGCVLGSALALSAPGYTALAVALAFGGLMAGLFARFGRWIQAALFLLGAGVITLGDTDPAMLMYLGEMAAGGLLFALLPREWDRRLCRILRTDSDRPAVEGVRRLTAMQLRVASGAMTRVAQSVDTVSKRLDAPTDMTAIYRECRTTVCGACPMRTLCWEDEGAMLAHLSRLTPLLEQDRVSGEDLPPLCRQRERLSEHIRGEYRRYITQEGAYHRLREIQQAVEGQMVGTGELLDGMARRLEDPRLVDAELSARVLAVCEDYGMTVLDALCTRDAGGRLTVDILAEDTAPTGRWHRQMEQMCGCTFTLPVTAEWGSRVRVTLTEPPRYRVESAVAQHRCDGERLCGDCARTESLPYGMLAILADGMGSGGRAAVDSAMAVGITAQLWTAGFSSAAVLQTVNAALQVKSREESLSTLDVVTVDTHTGRLDSYKAGAAPTFLRSQGRVSRLDRSGLPVGILPDVRFEQAQDTLSAGDILLMVSDGALSAGSAAVEEILHRHPEGESLQTLCDSIVAAARVAEDAHSDDITVMALRLVKMER
ncbi:MAG: SpoIIE family protein phosphatase [Clostridia bacterium]|nr:SpoIIE family protein phosphatase [Clostridia bacterium]